MRFLLCIVLFCSVFALARSCRGRFFPHRHLPSLVCALPQNSLKSKDQKVLHKHEPLNVIASNVTVSSSSSSKLLQMVAALRDSYIGYGTKSKNISLNGNVSSIPLTYMQTMIAGAVSRSIAQTLLHPAYTYKTILQLKNKDIAKITSTLTVKRLFQGIDAQFLMSLPHGALHFFVIDQVKHSLERYLPTRLHVVLDFTASAISTFICSIISTPQMVLTDRLMAGVYPNLKTAVSAIARQEGVRGFYRGWWPALAQKIPSYALTWMFFQQLQRTYLRYQERQDAHLHAHKDAINQRSNSNNNFLLGALAAAASVTVMIPFDTVKTRIVVQQQHAHSHLTQHPRMHAQSLGYTGVLQALVCVAQEEGIGALYRSLPPRLVAVVPMIALQFGLYEALKTHFQRHNHQQQQQK